MSATPALASLTAWFRRATAAPGTAAGASRPSPRAQWRALQRRFNQRSLRERLLVTAVAAALALVVADNLWLNQATAQFKAARAQQTTAANALETLNLQARQSRERLQSRQLQLQAELATWKQQTQANEAAIAAHEKSLVSAGNMLGLLEQLLARHGQVRVHSMRSLGRTDLLDANGAPLPSLPAAAAAGPKASGPAVRSDGTTLYRHGVELVLEGGYADLQQTLHDLEALPQHVLWGALNLQVAQYPSALLTVHVYTISRDRHWLEL
jgi:MSHA biogenesis protein MshJ